jgi:hypothetical protein
VRLVEVKRGVSRSASLADGLRRARAAPRKRNRWRDRRQARREEATRTR